MPTITEDGYEYEELDPRVHCQQCGVRVKIFPANILTGYTLLDHIKIVKNLWCEAQRITCSFDFDHFGSGRPLP